MSDATAVPDDDANPHVSVTVNEDGDLEGSLLMPLRPRRHTAPAAVRPPTTNQPPPGRPQSETDPATRTPTPRDPRRPGPSEDNTQPPPGSTRGTDTATKTPPSGGSGADPHGPGPGTNPIDTAVKDTQRAVKDAQNTVNNAVKGTPLDPANLQQLGQSLANSPMLTTLPLSLLQAGMSTLTSMSGMMAALVMAQAQFGQGTPSLDNSTYPGSTLNGNLNANRQNNWDGNGQDGYLTTNDNKKRKTDAIGQLDQGLKKLLEDSGENTRLGRAKIQQILDTVNQQLATLSPISNTAAGQAQIMSILTQAITQAGGIVAQGQNQSGVNAASLRNLASQYVANTANTPTPTGANLNLKANTPREKIAAKIIAEGKRRGYSDDEIKAILSTAIAESNLDANAWNPAGWKGVFQQDSSYPGRDDADQNIAAFYERLSAKRAEAPGDIWKDIFWLQQRPSEPNGEAAYANGRQAYLTEIQRHHDEANQLFNQVTAA